jgi:hypothetical protein
VTHHRQFSQRLYTVFFSILLVLVGFSFFTTPQVVSSQEVAPTKDSKIFGGAERRLYNGTPTKVPLKFEVRNLSRNTWVHDLEIAVTNTSSKPIYYLHMYITVPGAKDPVTGHPIGFLLKYGRIQLIDLKEPVQPDDIPIKPGATHVFKISESDAKSWETMQRQKAVEEPKEIELIFQVLNFGDGTGHMMNSGSYVDVNKKVSSNSSPPTPPPPRGVISSIEGFLPASHWPVNFFSRVSFSRSGSGEFSAPSIIEPQVS